METIINTQNEAKVIRSEEHQVVADQFCGKLTILPNRTVIANGFTSNIGHSHSQFEETYLVLEGHLRMALHNPITGVVTEVSLKKLDTVQIPRGTGHKVIGGSPDNCIMVSCDPHFIPGDENLCPQLEHKSSLIQVAMPPVVNIDATKLHKIVYAKGVIDDLVKYFSPTEKMTPSYFSKDLSEWVSIYNFHEFSLSGLQLSRRLEHTVEALVANHDVDTALIDRDIKNYFSRFLAAIESGDLLTKQGRSDGLIEVFGKIKPKSEVISELKQEILAVFESRIRQI